MAVYRYQVVCVGWWRGKIKRWNTTFHYSTQNITSSLHSKMNSAGWPNPGDTTGNCSGGVASISIYDAAGGAPLSVTTYFDWQVPGQWIPFTGTAWGSVDPDTPIDASGESAAVIVGHMGGLSASGKPVTTRKYLHAVPSRTSLDYADLDIDPADASALAALFPEAYMSNPAGVAPTSVTCEPYYLNHQRVRGRRRTQAQQDAQAFTAGVAVGASGAAGAIGFSGGGSF